MKKGKFQPSESKLQSLRAGSKALLEELHHKPDDSVEKVVDPYEGMPRSFVVRSGRVNQNLQNLVGDLRKVMAPFTALKLKESNKSTLKDFSAMASHFKVTNILAVGETSKGPTLRIGKISMGPTLTFRVKKYALCKQLRAREAKRRKKLQIIPPVIYNHSPIIILNNFPDPNSDSDASTSKAEKAKKLTGSIFQGMFPQLDVETVKLSSVKRILLVNWNNETNEVEIRHYFIVLKTKKVNKSLKKVLRAKDLDLSKLTDIGEIFESLDKVDTGNLSDYVTSDSELEGTTENQVKVAQRKNVKTGAAQVADKLDRKLVRSLAEVRKEQEGSKSATSGVYLQEIGPRLNLSLIKVEDGLFGGEVMYHAFQQKTEQEEKELRNKKKKERELKEKRRREQEDNVARKKSKTKKHKKPEMETESILPTE